MQCKLEEEDVFLLTALAFLFVFYYNSSIVK